MSIEPRALTLGMATLIATAAFAPLRAQTPALQRANIVEHLGAPVPRDVHLIDESGAAVTSGSFLADGKPVVLTFAYFSCQMLCPYVVEGLASGLELTGQQIGRDYRVVTVSIDPRDTPAVAQQWRARAIRSMGSAAPPDADWHFFTGDAADVQRLANAVGFSYARDPATGQYAHAAAVVIIGRTGAVSSYLYGISFDGPTLTSSLQAARAGHVRESLERFLVRCFHYVPALARRGGMVTWMLRSLGAAVIVAMTSLLWWLLRRDPAPGPRR